MIFPTHTFCMQKTLYTFLKAEVVHKFLLCIHIHRHRIYLPFKTNNKCIHLLEEIIRTLFHEGKQKKLFYQNKRTDRKCITLFFTPLCVVRGALLYFNVCMVMEKDLNFSLHFISVMMTLM